LKEASAEDLRRGRDGPCAILMIGLRPDVKTLHYPVSELAAKYGASAAKAT
jgi:hypothetical protein